MRPQLGPVVSAAAAQRSIWSLAQVRSELGHVAEPAPAERVLAVPSRVTIIDAERESMRRVEQRAGL